MANGICFIYGKYGYILRLYPKRKDTRIQALANEANEQANKDKNLGKD